MLRIDKLHVENFRKFAAFDIDFDSQLTVIAGDNGSGKTSILDALVVSLGTFFNKIENASSPGISKNDVRIRLTEVGSTLDRQRCYPLVLSATGRVADDRQISWRREVRSSKSKLTTADAKDMIHYSAELQREITQNPDRGVLPILVRYGTGRLWASGRVASAAVGKSTRTNGYVDALSAKLNERLFHTWMRKRTISEYQTGFASNELRAVLDAVAGCFVLPDAKEIHVRFDVEQDDLVIECHRATGERVVETLSTLSDGYRTALSMISDIASRMAMLNPQLASGVLKETPGIVLIDEVDLHLHPLWQARILQDLRRTFPRVQFIVTTHAPIVLSSVARRHVRILEDGAALVPASETYGRDANSMLDIVMGAPVRPVDVEQLFERYYDQFEGGCYTEASKTLDEIEAKIGQDDAELVSARTALFLETM